MKRLELFTDFRTIHGLRREFRWDLRVSGPYFQTVIVTQLLDGLIYLICELYIDDVLIDNADEDTFVNNVRQVFDRFCSHEMIVNPKKT